MADILLLDNLGSFTYNLVESFRRAGHRVMVYRNSVAAELLIQQLEQLPSPVLFLSSGPGLPITAGCTQQLLQQAIGKLPVIGVGLGYQAIVEAYGGTLVPAEEPLHGRTCYIEHDGTSMFQGLPDPLPVACYHSFTVADLNTMIPIAHLNSIVMAAKHEQDRVCGFQFIPDSILTPDGALLLEQTINWVCGSCREHE